MLSSGSLPLPFEVLTRDVCPCPCSACSSGGPVLARRMVFDTPEEDPNYNPLPEDQPETQPAAQQEEDQQHPQ